MPCDVSYAFHNMWLRTSSRDTVPESETERI